MEGGDEVMSKTIDERVVEMRFDNKQFESNVQTSLSTLDKLKRSLNLDGATKGLENVSAAANNCNMSGLRSAVETVHAKFSAFEVMAITALANITNSAVNAGKQMLRSLTIDPVKQGFGEYELKMGSIQTIMASTGENLETVNKYLNELNTYADRTIYSFSDMTNNIGKFTNAGVKLDDAVKAIQGISNEAAVSGANANEASRAMYNFAQALSAGYVKLIDWKSIENANMATVEFKDRLLETALAMGTVVKVGDMYQTTTTDAQGKVSGLFNATHNFNDALSAQWMTTDVLVKTLGDYADETTEIGKKAFAAAQDVKTFTQLMDTLKEAAGSGWAATWEIVFGNFEEAKELWTSVSTVVGGFIDSQSDARNSLLQGWKDLGGRAKLIEALQNAFEGLVSTVRPIGEAFREIFPKTTAEQLYSITQSLSNFTAHLKLSDAASANLKSTFKGLFAVLDIVKQVFSAVFRAITPLFSGFDNLGGGILGVTGKIGNFLVKIDDVIKKSDIFNKILQGMVSFIQLIPGKIESVFQSITGATLGEALDNIQKEASDFLDKIKEIFGGFGKIDTKGIDTLTEKTTSSFKPLTTLFDGIKKILGGIWEFFKKFTPVFAAITSAIGNMLGGIGISISNVLKNADFEQLFELVNGGVLVSIGIGIKRFIDSLRGITDNAAGFGESLKGILNSVKDCFASWEKDIKANTLFKIAGAIGILTLSLVVLSGIDGSKLYNSLASITALFIELSVSMMVMSKIGKVSTSNSISMIAMSVAALVLAAALKKLSGLDLKGIATGLVGLLGVTIIMEKAMEKLQASSQKYKNPNIKGLLSFAAAIGVLTLSLKFVSNLSISQMAIGLLGIAGLAVIMGGTIVGLKAASDKYKEGSIKGLLSFAAAIGVLTLSLKFVSNLSISQMAIGLLGIAGLAVIMGGTIVGLKAASDKYKEGSIKGLLSFAAAIGVLTISLNKIALLNISELAKGLLGIAGLAVIMGGTLTALAAIEKKIDTNSFIKISGALLIMASSILVLTPVIKTLGSMSWESIAKGLITIAAAFTILGIAGYALKPISSTILALSSSLALIGVAAVAFGAGLLAVSIALSAFAGSAAILVSAIVSILIGLITAIPDIVTALAKSLGEALPAIVDCIVAVATAALLGLNEVVPLAVETLLNIVQEVLTSLASHIQGIVESLLQIIVGILEGLAAGIPTVISSTIKLFKAIVDAIFEAIGGFDIGTILTATAALTALAAMMTLITVIAAEAVVATAVLPLIGMNLNKFIENAQPFLSEIQRVDSASLQGAKNLAETILMLTTAGIMDALTSWFTGGKSFIKFGEQLAEFAPYLKKYYIGIKGIDVGVVEASANAAKALTEMAANLPNSGGVLGFFAGENDIDMFGQKIVSFGEAMAKYSDTISGKIDAEAIKTSAIAGMALSELAKTLPNTGGVISWFTGENDINAFGKQLVPFGTAMADYSAAVSFVNPEAVIASANAGKALAELANVLPNTDGIAQWFAGGKMSMEDFGKQLVPFGTAMSAYSVAASLVNPEAVMASANAGKALAELSNVLPNTDGIAQWFAGGKMSMEDFGKQIVPFGTAMSAYSVAASLVNPEVVIASANAGKALAELINSLPNIDGIAQWFTGGKMSMEDFGKQLVPFGTAMADYSAVVSGKIDADAVTVSATAGKTLAELANTLPTTGGLLAWFTGKKQDLSSFGDVIAPFGDAMVRYSQIVSGNIDSDAVTFSATAGKALVELANTLPTTGGLLAWFTGKKQDLSSFGDVIAPFGDAMVRYSQIVSGNIDSDAVTFSATAGKALVELANTLPTTGGLLAWFTGKKQDLSSFGDVIVLFGNAMVSYSQTVKDLATEKLSEVIEETNRLIDLAKGMASLDTNKMSAFGDALQKIGKDSIDGFIRAFDDSDSKVRDRAEKTLSTFIDGIEYKKSEFGNSLQKIGKDSIDGFIRAFDDSDAKVRGRAEKMLSAFTDGIKNKKSEVTNAISSVAKGCESKYAEFRSVGAYLVDGFVAGITLNIYKAKAQAQAMAKAAADAAKRELDEHSPSKVGYEIGDYFGVAFVNALDDYTVKAYTSGSKIAESAKNGLNNAISKMTDLIDGHIDLQPTIRPILDLSNVEKGTNRISAWFSRSQALAINAEMSGESAYEIQNRVSKSSGGTQFNFTQNNYSPKPLSRIDIYRQTKNQFSAMKEAFETR